MWLPPIPQWKGVVPTAEDIRILAYTMRVAGKQTIIAALIACLLAALTLAPIDLERRLIDEIVAKSAFWGIAMLGLAYLGFQLLQQVIKVTLGGYQEWVTATLSANCRRELFEDHPSARKKDTGQFIEIITSETDHLYKFVGSGFSGAAADLLIMIGFMVWMVVIEREIALVSLAVFLPSLVFAVVIQRYLNRLNASRVRLLRRLAGAVGTGSRTSVRGLVRGVATNQFFIALLEQINKSVRNLLIALPAVLIMVYGGWLVIHGTTTIGTVVAFVSGFRKLADPLRSLLDFYVDYQKGQVQLRLIVDWVAGFSGAQAHARTVGHGLSQET